MVGRDVKDKSDENWLWKRWKKKVVIFSIYNAIDTKRKKLHIGT